MLKTIPYLINNQLSSSNVKPTSDSVAQTKPVAIMSPGSRIKYRRQLAIGSKSGAVRRGGSSIAGLFCPSIATGCHGSRSSSLSALVSIMALIASALVINLVIGQPIQPADGQSEAPTVSSGLATTTSATSSSSSPLGSRGIKRASQQGRQAAQQVLGLDQQQQQPQRQLTVGNGMAPFYSIKDGKTSARRIQQQQPSSPSTIQRNVSLSAASRGISSGNGAVSQSLRQNPLANDDGQRELAPQDMMTQDWRQTMTSGGATSVGGGGGATDYESDGLGEMMAGQEGVTTSGRTTTTPITSTGVSASDESSSADDSAENEVPAARTTSSSSANGKTKPAEFNQLAPMSVQQQQQQQLANMMTIGSFNQLVGSSGADRLADFKPSNSQTGEQSMDSDEETDDRQQLQQQRQIQSATSGAADGFPALSSSSLASNNGEPTTATTTDNNNNNRLQSTLVSNESADFRQQPTPIKQSVGRTQGTKQPGTKPAQRKQQKQQQQQQQTSSMPNSMQSIQQQETPGANSGGQLQASSLSMSLDGMIVNSRPRASGSTGASANEQLTATTSSGGSNQRGGSNQQNLKSSSGGNKSSQQQQSRLASSRQQPATNTFSLPPPTTTMATTLGGDSRTTQNVGVGAGQQQNGQSASAAGNVRRVPFSGAPFSSPASKGQRTKPKASNQFGGFSSAPANAPESLTSNQQQLQQQQVDSMSSGGQNGVVSERPSQAGFTMATLVGDNNSPNSLARGQQQLGAGDEDQQQKVSAVNVVEGEQQISNGGEELINSVMQSLNSMTNNGQTMRLATTTSATDLVDANMAPRFNQVATSKLPNGDMLMSVISSDDGRERKLVMISRDTLDSLQRFADQQQQDQQQTQQQQQQQQRITDVDSPAGVSSSGANMANWWPTTTTSTTVSTPTGGAQRQFDQSNTAVNIQRQQQQRQQTTTMMPISFSTSVAATQAPSFDTTDGFGSSTVVPSNDLGATMSGAGVASGSTTLSETTGNKNADTFREVSIQQANTTNGQQQQQVANKERLPGQAPAAKGSMRQQQKQQQQAGGSSRTNTVTTTSTAGAKQQQVSGTKTTKAKSKQTATGASSNGSGSSSSSLMVNGNDNGSARQQAQKQQQTLVDGEQANGNTSAGQRPVSTSSDSSSLSNGSVQIGSTSESGTSRQNGIVNGTKSKQKKTQQANNNGSRSSGRKQESTQGATATTTTATTTMAGVTTTTPTTTTKRTKSGGKTQKSQSSSGKQKQQAGSSKSASKNQSSRKQWATTSSSSGAANGDTTTGSVGSVATQTSVNQQQQTTTTQAPDLAPTVGTNGQQLPKGRPSGVTQSSVELDSSKGPSIDGGSNRPSVDILETNRRGENESVSLANETTSSVRPTTAPSSEMAAPGGSLGGGVSSSSSSRTELDRQLDEMERANAADADNQAAAMLDSERQGGQQQQRDGSDGTGAPISELDGLRAAVPGEPLVDYPIYSEPPARSSFQCQAQSCPGGYYADPDSQCQVFHVCQNDGRMDTFLCPNGTIFSQQHFVCVWWWQVDCSLSRSFYKLNDAIYCNAMTLPIDSNELTSPGDGGLVVADNSRQSPGATSSSGSADGTSSSIQDTDSGSPVGSANFNAATLQQQRQQQQQQQQTTKQRPLAGNHRSNNNNSGVIAGTPRTLTDGTTSTSTTTAGRTASTMPTNTGGRLSLVGPQSARQPHQQSITTTTASRRVNSNNQFDGSTSTSTQVTLTNLLQDDQDQEPGQVARNQTGQANGGQLNDNDMNQQQQQQLELLSRRAA